jgi:hypothetical protein
LADSRIVGADASDDVVLIAFISWWSSAQLREVKVKVAGGN